MLRLKKITISVLLVICSLISADIFSETKVEQYNVILDTSKEFIERVQASSSKKDNLAAIRVNGMTFCISSSIVNGFLVKDALPEGPIKEEAKLLYPAAFNPISVMDLLYLYSNDYTGLVNGINLQEKITAARNDTNRKLIEKMIEMFLTVADIEVSKYIIEGKITDLINNGDANLNIDAFDGVTEEQKVRVERLSLLRSAIIDFLHRLRKYSNEIAFIPNNAAEQYLQSNHLLSNKEDLTKLNTDIELITTTDEDIINVRDNKQVGALELLISKIDVRILCSQYEAKFSNKATKKLDSEYAPLVPSASNIVSWMSELYKLISSPWNRNLGGTAGNYMRAISHTEQMVDWISNKIDNNILVKISGKAPCLKCSHYIQYATTGVNFENRVITCWNSRTIIGFNTGWRDKDNSQILAYRYPVRVFNTAPEFGIKVKKFEPNTENNQFPNVPGTYDASEFIVDGILGISKSDCYAIEKVYEYRKHLRMTCDGHIIQIAELPILVHH